MDGKNSHSFLRAFDQVGDVGGREGIARAAVVVVAAPARSSSASSAAETVASAHIDADARADAIRIVAEADPIPAGREISRAARDGGMRCGPGCRCPRRAEGRSGSRRSNVTASDAMVGEIQRMARRADATNGDARARRGIAAVAGTGIFGDRRRRATSDLTTNESWKGAPHRDCFGGRRCQLPRFLLAVRNAIRIPLLVALGIVYRRVMAEPTWSMWVGLVAWWSITIARYVRARDC